MDHFIRTLAAVLRRFEPGSGPELETALAAIASGLDAGHVCVDTALARDLGPVVQEIRGRTRIVGQPGDFTPLILDGTRLYLGRYWRYEEVVARALWRLAHTAGVAADADVLRQNMAALFPEGTRANDQAVATLGAALRNLAIVSGGPGTGKTTTVARILALRLLLQAPGSAMAIRLAAPTGKAADRLREAITRAKDALRIPEEVKQRIPEEASTIHRLLGIRDESGRPGRTAQNPLHADLVVLDEASMVDLSLMARLVDAMPHGAALVLLGDKDQLDAVQPGSVFGDLCSNEGYSPAFLSMAETVLGEKRGRSTASVGLEDTVFFLTRSYRFNERNGISRLAAAVNAGNEDEAIHIARTDSSGELKWVEHDLSPGEIVQASTIAGWLRPYFRLVRAGSSEQECFEAFAGFRILTPLREGPYGVRALNTLVEQWLHREGLAPGGREWYPGKPVIVTVNNYTLNLFNGDVGITIGDSGGALRVAFPGEQGTFRSFSPARLPDHELAYATTVHKSQGSEFQQVLLLIPQGDNPVMTRNLLYTGITRARNLCEIHGAETALREGIRRKPVKMSGLADRLARLR